MADLLDIAASTASEAVWIDGQRISVRGVSFNAIASLVARFPELRSLANGGLGEDIVARLIELGGRAVGPIIAAGCGYLNDEAQEQAAAQLVLEHQMKLLDAVIGLSCPNGIRSFLEKTAVLMARAVGEGAKPKTHRFRSPKPLSSPLQPLSATDSPLTMQ